MGWTVHEGPRVVRVLQNQDRLSIPVRGGYQVYAQYEVFQHSIQGRDIRDLGLVKVKFRVFDREWGLKAEVCELSLLSQKAAVVGGGTKYHRVDRKLLGEPSYYCYPGISFYVLFILPLPDHFGRVSLRPVPPQLQQKDGEGFPAAFIARKPIFDGLATIGTNNKVQCASPFQFTLSIQKTFLIKFILLCFLHSWKSSTFALPQSVMIDLCLKGRHVGKKAFTEGNVVQRRE